MKNLGGEHSRPNKSDYRVTDNFELSLMHNQFAVANLEEELRAVPGTDLDKQMLKVLKQRTLILQSIVDEHNPEAKIKLQQQLDRHFEETEKLEYEWNLQGSSFDDLALEKSKRGRFKEYRKNASGEIIAVFSDWSSGDNEFPLNRKSLESQLKFLKGKGMDTNEVETALTNWPKD